LRFEKVVAQPGEKSNSKENNEVLDIMSEIKRLICVNYFFAFFGAFLTVFLPEAWATSLLTI
jgi:hypothetical protein